MNLSTLTRPLNGKVKLSKENIFSTIYETYDYDQFKILDANRDIKQSNYAGLVNSFQECYLLAMIIVNEKMEIIDGQHRFNAAKELGLPVRYVIMPGYGIKEVRQYNKTMQKWVKMDYRDSFATEGKDAYVELTEFMKMFPDFGIQVSLKLLTGLQRGETFNRDGGVNVTTKDFQSGNLSLGNVHQAYPMARKILDFKDYYDGFNSPTFVGALLPILKKKIYDHKRMIQKLKSSGIHLVKCGTQEQYRLLLQKIYNYKVKPEEKADFFNI